MSRPLLTAAEREIGGVTLLVLLAGVLIAATMSPNALDRQTLLASVELPEHRIIDLKDQADGRLLIAHVVVEGTPDADGLIGVVATVVDRLREERVYSGLRVNLYDHAIYREVGPTLGHAEDAPEGDWTRALRSVRDYRLHRTAVEVKDKDWDQSPSGEHAEVFVAIQQQQWEVHEEEADGDSTERVLRAQAEAAERLGVSLEDIADAFERASRWTASGETVRLTLE